VALLFVAPVLHAQHNWHMDWGDWNFDYGIYDGSGLELRNVMRKGELILNQASLPTMRVDYAAFHHKCNESPFSDILWWGNTLPRHGHHATDITAPLATHTSWCGHKVCVRSYTVGNTQWLELGILASEGNYLIYQAWYLSDEGHIAARLFSKGEQCPNSSHRHHPYWRFDFAIGGAPNSVYQRDDVDIYGNPPADVGFGPGVTRFATEGNALKDYTRRRTWFVQNDQSGHAVWIVPGSVNGHNDEAADSFAPSDFMAVAFHPNEVTGPWTDHKQGNLDVQSYINGENLVSANDVVWYVSHFTHIEPLNDPSALCSEVGFPSVLASGVSCNDVLSSGVNLVSVLGPNDVPPVRSFDFGVAIKRFVDECGRPMGAPAGAAKFQAVVQGVPPEDSVTYRWSAVNGTPIPPTNGSTEVVQFGNPTLPLDISLAVTVNTHSSTGAPLPVSKTASLRLPVETVTVNQKVLDLRCEVIGHELFNPFANPLVDPLRDLRLHPYSPDELRRIRDLGLRLSNDANQLLQQGPH